MSCLSVAWSTVAQLEVFFSSVYLLVVSPFLVSSWCVNLIRVVLHDDTFNSLKASLRAEHFLCTSTTINSRVMICYQ